MMKPQWKASLNIGECAPGATIELKLNYSSAGTQWETLPCLSDHSLFYDKIMTIAKNNIYARKLSWTWGHERPGKRNVR